MYEEGTYICFRIDINQLYKYYCPIINNLYRIYLSYISHVHVSSTNDWGKNSSFFGGGEGDGGGGGWTWFEGVVRMNDFFTRSRTIKLGRKSL